MLNTTEYGWAFVHPTLGPAQARGPMNSVQFQSAAPDSNAIGKGDGSADFTWNDSTKALYVNGTFETGGDVTIGGNLTVKGSTTTIESTTITVDDIHIEIGATASPSDP